MSAQKNILLFLLVFLINSPFLSGQSLELIKSVNAGSIQTGLEFTYILQYRCASTTSNCENVIISDTIPEGLEFISYTENPIHSSNTTYDANTRIITFELNKETGTGLKAGSTGEVLLKVRFPNGPTPNNAVVRNHGFIVANNAPQVESDTVETTAIATSAWQVNKTNNAGGTIYLDTPFTYRIRVSDASDGTGGLDLDTFTLVDQLPVGAVFESATDGGVYDMGAGTVTWTFGALSVDNTETVMVTLTYPSTTFNENDMVTNQVDLFGQPLGEPYGPLDMDDITGTLSGPDPVGAIDKSVSGNAAEFIIGDSLNYDIQVSNIGSTDLDAFLFVDTIPAAMALYQMETGIYNDIPNGLAIRYQTNQNATWQTWTGSPFTGLTSEVLNVSDLGLGTSEYISMVEYNFGTVPFGFETTNDIDLHAYILTTDQNGQAVVNGATITNCADLSYSFEAANYLDQDCVGVNVREILPPGVKMDKDANTASVAIGGELNYMLLPANIGDFPMDSIVMIDVIPVQMDFVYTESGGWNNLTEDVEVYYQTNLNNNFRAWTDSPYAPISDTQLYESTLGLDPNEYVTVVKWVFRNPDRGFEHNGNRPRIKGTLLEVDRDGNPVNVGDLINNCADLTGYIDGTAYADTDCDDMTANPPIVQGDPDKRILENNALIYNTGPLFPGDTVVYVLEIEADPSTTDTLINPIMMDLLPPEVTYIPNSWEVYDNDYGHPIPIFENIPNYNNTSQTLLRWSWTGASAANFLSGEDFFIRFKVVVNPNVVAEQIVYNTAYQTTNDVDNFSCDESFILDLFDLDGDNSTSDIFCHDETTTQFSIQTVASLESEKLVKGQCDSVYTKFPDFGQTVPGGDVNYRLLVRNNGTVPMTEVKLIDILPYVGDMGVIDLSNRDTRWRPNLISTINVPSGVTVYYSTTSNPCRSAEGIEPNGPAGCQAPNWSTIPPTDMTSVQSFKLDFGNMVINPGDELTIEWDMRAPVDVLDVIGSMPDTIAWNSFGYIGRRIEADGSLGNTLLAAEPIKVGIKVKVPTKAAYGDLVWYDTDKDGILDGGEMGVDGVKVELYMDDGDGINNPATDSLIAFTLTTGGGLYLFPELDPADYYAVFYPPPTYKTTVLDNGLDEVDSDGVPSLFNGNNVAITPITTLVAEEQDLTWDLGIYQTDLAAVGNYVWYDENKNGLQDESTTNGLDNITVILFNSGGTPVDTTVTAVDLNGNPGYYLFDSIPPGDYYIQFEIPNSFQVTTAQQEGTGSDPTDSDAVLTADTTIAQTDVLTLVANQYDPNWDAGLILPTGTMSLGNFVWIDTNNSGDFNPNTESGVNDVKVNLYEDTDGNGVFTPNIDLYLSTTTTQVSGGKSGYYLFENLAEGDYIVQIDASSFSSGNPLNNHNSSTGNGIAPDPDNDLNFDDNGEPLDGYGVVSQAITLVQDTEPSNDEDTNINSNLTVDFGFFPGNACRIFINDLAFNNCDENNGNPQFDLEFDINWLDAPDPQEDIILMLNGNALNPITTASPESNSVQSYSMTIAADGTTSELQAYFATSDVCGDTTTFTANLGCPLKMIKTADSLTTIVGDTIIYNYQVINNGTEPMELSNITDDKIGEIETLSGATEETRVEPDLQVLYRFQDGAGTTISDVSGIGDPLDLTIEGTDYLWDADTLIFTDENRASNVIDNNKIYENAILSNEITVEAWVTPANNTQSGPARIINLSASSSARNFSLVQEGTRYEVRLRTTTNGNNGTNTELIGGTVTLTEPSHVVFTRDATGNAVLYVNGVVVDTETIGGDFSNWDSSFDFGIGNEFGGAHDNGVRDWQGAFHLGAVYTRALSAAEITQNYNVGLVPPPTVVTLPAGDTINFTAAYEVLPSDLPGPVVNEATIFGTFGDGSTTSVMDTASVKITCEDLTITAFTQNACDDNNTGSNDLDDFFTITINAETTGANAQYEVIRNLGEVDELVLATVNYGVATTIGTNGDLKANGTLVYTITIRDSINTDCQESFTTTAVESCSDCPPEICLPIQTTVKRGN